MSFDSLEKLYKRKLTAQEISEASQNLDGFFELLIEIDLEQNRNDRYNSLPGDTPASGSTVEREYIQRRDCLIKNQF